MGKCPLAYAMTWAGSGELSIQTAEFAHLIRAGRAQRDDKVLDVAVAGGPDAIVTGDGDLLALDPFEGVAIVTPARLLTVRPE
jgi:predicted nucleic acid-binding protein